MNRSSPCGIKQDYTGQFYMVGPNGARILCAPPVLIKLVNRTKTLYDPEGREYQGGFTSAKPEHREHMLVSRDGGLTWRRVDFSMSG